MMHICRCGRLWDTQYLAQFIGKVCSKFRSTVKRALKTIIASLFGMGKTNIYSRRGLSSNSTGKGFIQINFLHWKKCVDGVKIAVSCILVRFCNFPNYVGMLFPLIWERSYLRTHSIPQWWLAWRWSLMSVGDLLLYQTRTGHWRCKWKVVQHYSSGSYKKHSFVSVLVQKSR